MSPTSIKIYPEGRYDEASKETTPQVFGPATVTRLEDLCRIHPTVGDIKDNKVKRLADMRDMLEVDLENLLATIPSRGETPVRTQSLELIHRKLGIAYAAVQASKTNELPRTIDINDPLNLWTALDKAHDQMTEVVVILRLYLEKGTSAEESQIKDINVKVLKRVTDTGVEGLSLKDQVIVKKPLKDQIKIIKRQN